jgi:uncharacterized membrane protein YjjB (DUF3815 family)
MKKFKKYIPSTFWAFIGAILGYLYYIFVGCNGSCMIASSPWFSTMYGTLLGILLGNVFRKSNVKQEIS